MKPYEMKFCNILCFIIVITGGLLNAQSNSLMDADTLKSNLLSRIKVHFSSKELNDDSMSFDLDVYKHFNYTEVLFYTNGLKLLESSLEPSDTVFLVNLIECYHRHDNMRFYYLIAELNDGRHKVVFVDERRSQLTKSLGIIDNNYFKEQLDNIGGCPQIGENYILSATFTRSEFVEFRMENRIALSMIDSIVLLQKILFKG